MQNFETHFNNPIEILERDFSHKDLVNFLRNGNVIERQYSALNIEKFSSETEAELFISNLVGVDGKIREVVAFRLPDFVEKYPNYFDREILYNYFSNATIDIDGNVCRFVIEASCKLKFSENFSNFYSNELKNIIDNALEEISTFTFRDKKYKINKQIFKIYWCLEGLNYFQEYLSKDDFVKIITKCSLLPEYTVREKCAQILINAEPVEQLKEIKENLLNDENYYVRSVFKK